jgi:hypothetical protein
MNATLVPIYLGLSGQDQGGLIAGAFVVCIILTAALITVLFNPCNATLESVRFDCAGCCCCCCCSSEKEDNWCYLCLSVVFLRCYYYCCCRKCCARHRKWVGKRTDTLKGVLQNEIDAGWYDITMGDDDDDDDDDEVDEPATNEL